MTTGLDALDLDNCAVLVARIPDSTHDSDEAASFRDDLLTALRAKLGQDVPLVVFLSNPDDSLEVLSEDEMREAGWLRAAVVAHMIDCRLAGCGQCLALREAIR